MKEVWIIGIENQEESRKKLTSTTTTGFNSALIEARRFRNQQTIPYQWSIYRISKEKVN